VTPAPEPARPSDGRGLRLEQGTVAIALLAGFVFRVPWVMTILAVLLALTLFSPGTNLFLRAHDALFAGRATDERHPEAPGLTFVTRLVEIGLLALGTVVWLLGAPGFAWVFGLPVAAITGIAATTGFNVVAFLLDVRHRR
jgi:hypothetical protein